MISGQLGSFGPWSGSRRGRVNLVQTYFLLRHRDQEIRKC